MCFYLTEEESIYCNDCNCLHGNDRQLWHLFLCKGKKLHRGGTDPAVVSHGDSESGPCILNAAWSEGNAEPSQEHLWGPKVFRFWLIQVVVW